MDEVSSAPVDGVQAAIPVSEETYSKSHVTDLVKREKDAAYRKAEREFQAQLEQMKTGQTQTMGGMQQANPEEISQQVMQMLEQKFNQSQEESRKAEYTDFVNNQARTYLEKMDKGSGLADDFKEMTAKFKPDKFKEVFFMANSYENTPHIIYELGKNPYKLAQIQTMMERDPDLAKEMMDSLSKSIVSNEQAKENNKSAEAPLSRPKPSLGTGVSSGEMNLADLKKATWLRG